MIHRDAPFRQGFMLNKAVQSCRSIGCEATIVIENTAIGRITNEYKAIEGGLGVCELGFIRIDRSPDKKVLDVAKKILNILSKASEDDHANHTRS